MFQFGKLKLLAASALALGLVACEPEVRLLSEGCLECHRGGAHEGIEVPHRAVALACTDCHGGDGTARTKDAAHASDPSQPKHLRELSRDELELVDEDYLRFVNPSHPAAAARGCGSGNPLASQFTGCHQLLVDSSRLSVHATNVGLVNIPRYESGILPGRSPTRAIAEVTNLVFQPSIAPPFSYEALQGIAPPLLARASAADPRPFLEHAMTKACSSCHLGVNDAPVAGGPRGRGCAACHMPYAEDGLSRSGDPVIDKAYPSHPEQHVLLRTPDASACERCHATSQRIGPSFRGWRERAASDLAEDRLILSEAPAFGLEAGAWVIDEDARNDRDETPADLHQLAGMTCVDCHFGQDVHGDGHIYSSMGRETGIECEDCHGSFDALVTEEGGVFRATGGDPIARLARQGDRIIHRGADGREREVTQIARLRKNPDLEASHEPSHHGELECYACHTGWMQNYYQVHRTLDLRGVAWSPLDGMLTPGQVSTVNEIVSVERFHLGLNVDGRIGPFMARNEVFSVIIPCVTAGDPDCTLEAVGGLRGKYLVERWIGASSEGRSGFSWGPVFQHTVPDRARVRRCSACHLKGDRSNLTQVREVYGFGSGELLLEDRRTGQTIDLTRMIADTGTAAVALGTLLARPLPLERIQRAMNTTAP